MYAFFLGLSFTPRLQPGDIAALPKLVTVSNGFSPCPNLICLHKTVANGFFDVE
jgi:hypothetical protein